MLYNTWFPNMQLPLYSLYCIVSLLYQGIGILARNLVMITLCLSTVLTSYRNHQTTNIIF